MRRLFILTLLLSLSYLCQARIARFYFSKAYVCSCRADRYDTPISGTFIITFDTTEKTISVYYNVPGVQSYSYTTKYKSVKETHSPSDNCDYYTLAGPLYDDYIITNTYDKRRKMYGVEFSLTSLPDAEWKMFGEDFLKFFGAPSDWNYWPTVFFEKPYKVDSKPQPDYSTQSSGTTGRNSLVNHIYSGIVHSGTDEYVEQIMTVYFISDSKLRVKVNTKIKGADDIPAFQLIQMMMGAEGENVQEGASDYTYKNGIVILKNSTDRLKVLNDGKELRWYVESNDEGAKKFNAILKRIQ